MEKIIFNVEGMSCQHCVKAITKAVGVLPGISSVNVDLASKTVTVEHDPTQSPAERLRLQIEEQGFEVVS